MSPFLNTMSMACWPFPAISQAIPLPISTMASMRLLEGVSAGEESQIVSSERDVREGQGQSVKTGRCVSTALDVGRYYRLRSKRSSLL